MTDKIFVARWVALSAALAVFALVLFAPQVLNDGDTYLHITAGRWMLENRAVERIDFFSYTFAGRPWLTHEWLAEVIMALAYVAAGWSGCVFLFALVSAIAIWSMGMHLARWLSGPTLVIVLILSLSCMTGSFLARPHLFAWPLLVIWTAHLVRAAEEHRRPPWWLLPLMVLWANLHASFLFGLMLLLPMMVEDAWGRQSIRATARDWLPFAALALAASLLTPHGIEGLLFPFKLALMPQLDAIGEWSPLDLHQLQPAVLVIGFTVFVLVTRAVKINPIRVLVLLGLVYLALAHTRHLVLLAVVAPLLLARPLAEAFYLKTPLQRPGRRPLLAFAALFLVLTVVRFAMPVVRGEGIATPAKALSHVPASLLRTPVLNDYSFGAYLIFRDVRPFIDSRAELYGGRFLNRYAQIQSGNPNVIEDTLSRYHIRWTILRPENGAVGVIDRLPGWHRVYEDQWAVVQVKGPV